MHAAELNGNAENVCENKQKANKRRAMWIY